MTKTSSHEPTNWYNAGIVRFMSIISVDCIYLIKRPVAWFKPLILRLFLWNLNVFRMKASTFYFSARVSCLDFWWLKKKKQFCTSTFLHCELQIDLFPSHPKLNSWSSNINHDNPSMIESKWSLSPPPLLTVCDWTSYDLYRKWPQALNTYL